jgi:hypothetical protein
LASVALLVLGCAPAALAQDSAKERSGEVRINAFGDWRYGATNNDNLYLSAEPDGSFKFAHFGVVMSKEVSSKVRFETSALFTGEEHDIDLIYAFANVQLSNHVSLRVGQVKQPFGLFSEVVQIGTLRPFVALPQSVYGPSGMAPEAVLGASLTGQSPLGSHSSVQWDVYFGGQSLEEKHTAEEAWLGEPLFEDADVFKFRRNMVGGRALFELPVEGLRLGGAGYSAEEVGGHRHQTAIGSVEYVRRPIELRGELIHQHAEDDLNSTGWYAEAAYRIDSHWQIAGQYQHYRIKLLEEPEGEPGPDSLLKHDEAVAGLNFWVTPTFALKFNYSRINGNRFALPEQHEVTEIIEAGHLHPKTSLLQFAAQFAF